MYNISQDGEEELDGRASPPPPALASRMTSVGTTLPPLTAKEKPPINVVGDVGGKGWTVQIPSQNIECYIYGFCLEFPLPTNEFGNEL